MRVPQNGEFVGENPIEMDDLGVAPFVETSNLIQFAHAKTLATGRPIPARPLHQIWPVAMVLGSYQFSKRRFFCTGKNNGARAPRSQNRLQHGWYLMSFWQCSLDTIGGCLKEEHEPVELNAHFIAISQLSAHVFLLG